MLWNWLKSVFWCGVFHDTELCMDLSHPDREPTPDDIGQVGVCKHCGALYDII